jgi:Catechol dioxygenase N terminus
VSEVASDLIKNLREFIHKHHITHPEYRQVVDFLQETAKQSEIPLLIDGYRCDLSEEEGNREYSRGSVLRSRITHA